RIDELSLSFVTEPWAPMIQVAPLSRDGTRIDLVAARFSMTPKFSLAYDFIWGGSIDPALDRAAGAALSISARGALAAAGAAGGAASRDWLEVASRDCIAIVSGCCSRRMPTATAITTTMIDAGASSRGSHHRAAVGREDMRLESSARTIAASID